MPRPLVQASCAAPSPLPARVPWRARQSSSERGAGAGQAWQRRREHSEAARGPLLAAAETASGAAPPILFFVYDMPQEFTDVTGTEWPHSTEFLFHQ